MHVHFLDPYRPRDSLLHNLDARVKLLLAIAFILTCALLPSGVWGLYVLLLAFILAGAILADLGPGYLLKRAFLALPFALAALPLIFSIPGQPLVAFRVFHSSVQISLPGIVRFTSIALKSWISVQAAILLTATTPFPQLLVAMRAIGLPRLLVAIIGLMWRYLFILVDEAMRLMRARESRSGGTISTHQKTGGSLTWRARVTGGMVGSLFLRAFDRSDRIYMAMIARGYDGEVRSLPQPGITRSQKAILFAGLLIFVLLVLSGLIISR